MFLKKFTLPKTDVRMVTIDNKLFKVAIHLVKQPNRDEKSYEEFFSNPKHQEEIEKIMIILLTCKSEPGPIKTDNLTVYPYRKKWEVASLFKFYRHKKPLESCPFQTHFYIEPKVSRKHDTDARKQSIQFQKMTKHQSCHRQSFESSNQVKKTENDAEIRTEIQSKSQNKTVEKPSELYNEREDEESVSILSGPLCKEVMSPKDIGTFSSSSNESSVDLSTQNGEASSEIEKQDIKAVEMESSKTIELILVTETIGQTRKRRKCVLDEAPPKKRSATEYLDTNRHTVQEQELQEGLRLQNIATTEEEKPVAMEERGPAMNERKPAMEERHFLFSSIKALLFG